MDISLSELISSFVEDAVRRLTVKEANIETVFAEVVGQLTSVLEQKRAQIDQITSSTITRLKEAEKFSTANTTGKPIKRPGIDSQPVIIKQQRKNPIDNNSQPARTAAANSSPTLQPGGVNTDVPKTPSPILRTIRQQSPLNRDPNRVNIGRGDGRARSFHVAVGENVGEIITFIVGSCVIIAVTSVGLTTWYVVGAPGGWAVVPISALAAMFGIILLTPDED